MISWTGRYIARLEGELLANNYKNNHYVIEFFIPNAYAAFTDAVRNRFIEWKTLGHP